MWTINILKQYFVKGYVLDKERLKNGSFLDYNYFDELLQEIISKRNFYLIITDIYFTSLDYNFRFPITQELFKAVQNKMHYATHGNTAIEVIVERTDGYKDFMGLINFSGDYSTLLDDTIAKNYLTDKELYVLNRIVSMYLDYAEL